MLLLLTLAFPGLLLALVLAMDRVETPFRDEAIGDDLVQFLEEARPDEVETFVRDGLAPALDRYWRRHWLRDKLLPRRIAARS